MGETKQRAAAGIDKAVSDRRAVSTPEDIVAAASRLRRAHLEILTHVSQDRIVDALSTLARRWRSGELDACERARAIDGPFGREAVRFTLDALLESLTPERLGRLIDDEQVCDRAGYPVVGHVIAGNTPLLAWTSIMRGLLVRSASLVKLPSPTSGDRSTAPIWAETFVDALAEVDAELASTIELVRFWGGDDAMMSAYCTVADLVVAYGSERAILHLRELRRGLPFVGYGHRVSIGLVLPGADLKSAADGFALDTLLYDQGGCLSPQSIYVVGSATAQTEFAKILSDAFAIRRRSLPSPERTESNALRIHQTRALARMDGCQVWEGDDLVWTVIARPGADFAGSPTLGVISVQSLTSTADLPRALAAVDGLLQGCAVASDGPVPADVVEMLARCGVSYLCEPGRLQMPPIDWREDDLPVLQSLLPDFSAAFGQPN